MKKFLIILLIPFLLVSCGKNEEEKTKTTPDNEQANVSDQEQPAKEDSANEADDNGKEDADIKDEPKAEAEDEDKEDSKDDKDTEDEKDAEDDKDSKDEEKSSADDKNSKGEDFFSEDEMDKFHKMSLDFINKLDPKNEIASEWYEDFNSDGKTEGVVFIKNMEQINEVVFLNMEDEDATLLNKQTITNLGNDLIEDDIIYDSAGFMDINGFAYTVPYVSREQRLNSSSYMFFNIEDNCLNSFLNTANNCDVGTTELIDEDDNGSIDYFVLNRWGYDVFYYPLTLIYKFDPDLYMVYESGSIELAECPTEPIDIVKEYMFLSYIRDNNYNRVGEYIDIENLDERLAELTDLAFETKFIFSKDLLTNLAIQISDGTEIAEEVYSTIGSITIRPLEDNQQGDKITNFVIEKKDDKWKITRIEFLE